MRLRILVLALIAVAVADENTGKRPSRAPQGQIKYRDTNGAKVNWKFFTPEAQYQSSVITAPYGNAHRSQRAEEESATPQQAEAPQPKSQQAAPIQVEPNQQYYNSYEAVPTQIKQLVDHAYGLQRPYVDPSAFFYSSHFGGVPQQDQQPATAENSEAHAQQNVGLEQKYQSRRDHDERRSRPQGGIQYTEDEQRQQQPAEHGDQFTIPVETMPFQPIPPLYIDKNMPADIQKLLQYQAQIPYDVTANRILYTPKKLFIPKPLPDDAKGSYSYRTKIYYMKNDEILPDYDSDKPVEEGQSN